MSATNEDNAPCVQLIEEEAIAPSADSIEMASRINITDEQIESWKADLMRFEAQQAETAEKIAQIRRALASVEELEAIVHGHPSEVGAPISASTDEVSARGMVDDMSLADAIPAVVKKFGRPMSPAMIKKHLKDVGYTKEVTSYFYTAVARCAEKKTISKTRNGRYTYSGHGNGMDRAR